MELIVSVVALIGIFAGSLLAKLTKEELKPGEKYFHITERILWYIAFLISILQTNTIAMIIIVLGFFLHKKMNKNMLQLTYLFIPLFVHYGGIVVASLWFMYGLAKGTLRNQVPKELVKQTYWFWIGLIAQAFLVIVL